MSTLLYDRALRHDGYDVRCLDGGQSVGNDDTGASTSGLIQSSLDRLGLETSVFPHLLTLSVQS